MPKSAEFRRSSTILTRMRLRNFRCYEDSGDVQLSPLTVIIGENNSGKSTLIDAILLAKQSASADSFDSGIVTAGEEVDLGGFFDILRGGSQSKEKEFTISLELTITRSDNSRNPKGRKDLKKNSIAFETIIGFSNQHNLPMPTSTKLKSDNKLIAHVVNVDKGTKLLEPSIGRESKLFFRYAGLLPIVFSMQHRAHRVHDKKAISVLENITQNYFVWRNFLRGVQQIRPLRGPIPRYSILGRTPTAGFGGEGEALLRTLRNTRRMGHNDLTLIEAINKWLAERLGIVKKIRLSSLDRDTGIVVSLVADEKEGFESINLANMGEGLSQMLPVFAKVLGLAYEECVVVQQPEIHLHPALQADLADLFIDNLVAGNVRQCIVETHSEHLLLRLRRRVAEGKIDPENVSVLYVTRVGNHSEVRRLNLGKDGHFDFWPEGFFEQDVEEAYRLSKASRK